MILLDCSEFMRNGDYVPTRLEAQQDAANLLVGAKTQSNQESTVGISAGTELLLSPSQDVGKILHAIRELRLHSEPSDVTAAVQVASLALKHRQNKNGSQRIVLFVGTPLDGVESRALQKAGRQLKKNNVHIDVVAMGELEQNEEKLRELVDAANGRNEEAERTCNLVTIPAGVLPSDVLASSPILADVGGAFAASAAAAAAGGFADTGNSFADYGGVDPNMDPELAMALRVSMEEERARQERMAAQAATEAEQPEAGGGGGGGGGEAKQPEGGDAEMTEADNAAAVAAAAAADMGLSEEEALLQQALAMSMNENEPSPPETSDKEEEGASKKPAAATEDVDMDQDEDAAMQMALQMSMQTDEAEAKEGESKPAAAAAGGQFQDPAFVNELLGSMPGVDPNDPEIQEALRRAQEKKKKDEDKKE
jgi:26S proteasome regulatory subunit N10